MKRLVSITCFSIHISLAILFMMHNFWFCIFFLSIAVLFLLQSSLGEVPRQRQTVMSARSFRQQEQQSFGSPKFYKEPEAEPISPQGGVARPWITWVRGLQQTAPIDMRSIIMTIFQRLFQTFFSGIAAGGLGRFTEDSRLRSQRITEFRKALRGELKKALSSATSSASKSSG